MKKEDKIMKFVFRMTIIFTALAIYGLYQFIALVIEAL